MVLNLLPQAPEWKPWEQEPDEMSGSHYGLPIHIKRQPRSLHLCGYVDVPLSHPFANTDWDYNLPTTPDNILSVHGGVTYHHEHDEFFRIGFDCARAGDRSPGYRAGLFGSGIYRDFTYVTNEVMSLAQQLFLVSVIDEALRGL